MELKSDQAFESRKKISALLGGDVRKGIAKSAKTNTILLFTNSEELYSDYFYPVGTFQ